MTQALPQAAREHHDRLLHHVNQMPEIGDALLTARSEEVTRSVGAMSTFLTETLIPHIDAAERTVYPELERMFQNRHSMAPMRREHEDVRRLVTSFVRLGAQMTAGPVTIGRELALRRVLFQLYALLKIHLEEEEMYLRIVEHGVTADVADLLAAAMEHPGFRTA